MSGKTFRELFCAVRVCADSEYEARVFWECIYPQGRWLARLIWRWKQAFFEPDLELIRDAGALATVADVKAEISNFRYHHPARGFMRGGLKVRLSGQRLLDLAAILFRTEG